MASLKSLLLGVVAGAAAMYVFSPEVEKVVPQIKDVGFFVRKTIGIDNSSLDSMGVFNYHANQFPANESIFNKDGSYKKEFIQRYMRK